MTHNLETPCIQTNVRILHNIDAAKYTYLTVYSFEHSYIYIYSLGSKAQSLNEVTEEVSPM
jgi:hypothetical protein